MTLSLWINKKSKFGYSIKRWNYDWPSNKFWVYNFNNGRADWYYDELPSGHVCDFQVVQGEIILNTQENVVALISVIPKLKGWARIK